MSQAHREMAARVSKPFIHACWKPETAIRHLPQAYKDFYSEWKHAEPVAVHYEPTPGNWYKDERTGEIKRTYNLPLELHYAPELETCLTGGEAVVKGYTLSGWRKETVPRWWVPKLKKVVFYSEVLDRYLEVLATQRAEWLVHKHYGLDFYLLQTRACDIVTLLGLKIKREILLSLARRSLHPNNTDKQAEVLAKYDTFIVPEQEAEWYGLTVDEALKLHEQREAAANPPRRLKQQLRREFIANLQRVASEQNVEKSAGAMAWVSKVNPFRGESASK